MAAVASAPAMAHEEADTKIVFHVCKLDFDAHVTIRCSDTDIAIIMLGNLNAVQKDLKITMHIGTGNSQTFINIMKLYEKLGANLCSALPGFHAITGCDFNPALYRKVPGMECLMQSATVIIHKTRSGYHGNKYTVLSEGEALFTLHEDVPNTIFCPGVRRAFIFDGVENTGRKLFRSIHILNTVEMYMDNQLASVIRMEETFITPIFTINDPQARPVIRLKGKIPKTTNFELQTNTKVPIGSIQKQRRGWKEEIFAFDNDFIINFPADLAVQYKLAVIVACVYIDFKYCESW